jgi:hypothetical protein
MSPTIRSLQSRWAGTLFFFLLPLVGALVNTAPCAAQQNAVPRGTILPVILRTTLAPDKMKQGEPVRGQIAQDVPLPGGSKIPKGSRVEGHITEAGPQANRLSIRFDKLVLRGQEIPITTDLRAVAGFMEVLDASLPDRVPGEGDVTRWETTTQIGGDSVYGEGGPVMSAENATERVGKSVPNGVLVQVAAKPGSGCRGALDNHGGPQAMWVFSSDACGVYGLSKVTISHAGRTDPIGTITLDFQDRSTKIRNGAGLLLRAVG